MTRRVAGALLALIAATAAVSAQEGPPTAVDRVRAKLEKAPPKLILQQRTPDFTVHIEKRRPMQDIFDVPAWATDPIGWQPPGLGFDLLGAFRYVAKGVAEAKRGHDERLAREDVQHAIADYCAAQPNSASIQICATSPAIR